jgi:hypothetical protein
MLQDREFMYEKVPTFWSVVKQAKIHFPFCSTDNYSNNIESHLQSIL